MLTWRVFAEPVTFYKNGVFTKNHRIFLWWSGLKPIWYHFEREAKKNRQSPLGKYSRLLVNNFSNSCNTLTIHLLASWNDHLPFANFRAEKMFMKRKDYYEWCCVCLALTTICWLVNFKAMFLNGFSIGDAWGMFEVVYLPAGGSYWSAFCCITSGIWRASQWCKFFAVRWWYQKLIKNNNYKLNTPYLHKS